MFKERLENIQREIEEAKERSGRKQDVTVLAVSKRFPVEDILEAYNSSGHAFFGENRIQEALKKAEELRGLKGLELHFIGRIQTNKVKFLKNNFALIHSVDSVRLAEKMQEHFLKHSLVQDVLVQVNIAEDENKTGVGEEDVSVICAYISSCDNLRLRGLMMMPPLEDDVEENRVYFRRMKSLFDDMNSRCGYSMDILSMGMSGDYLIAVEEGSTMVRIGTALFGQRQY